MQIGIAGAGAVGCFFGGLLQQAGHKVTFVARGKHLEALQKNGLTINRDEDIVHIDRTFTDNLIDLSECELILFCVKSNDTERITKQLLPINNKNALIMSKHNVSD